jgi:hypothetical protein
MYERSPSDDPVSDDPTQREGLADALDFIVTPPAELYGAPDKQAAFESLILAGC